MRGHGNVTLQGSVGEHADSPQGQKATVAHFVRDMLYAQRSGIPWAVLALVLAAVLLGAAYYVTAVTGRSIDVLLRDANAIAQQPNYFGALDHAEVLLMGGAGWISLFAATLQRDRSALFLGLGGLLSLLLALDNLYMLHESSWRFHLNEKIVFGFYGLLLALLVVTDLRRFLNTPFVLLGIATFLFMAAVLIDALPLGSMRAPAWLEDCLELVGVCFWIAYFVKCSRDGILERLPEKR